MQWSIKDYLAKHQSLKSAIQTLLFYSFYFLLSYIAEFFVKSGACTPGLGFLLLLFLPVLSLILFFVNLIRYFAYQKKYVQFSVIIHSLVLFLFIVYYLAISNNH